MIGKAWVASLAAPILMSAAKPEPASFEPQFMDHPAIAQIMCGGARGTAFRTGQYAYTTAAHVVGNEPACMMDGEMIPVTYRDGKLDFATLRTETPGEPLPIDCGGFVYGTQYWGVGYAGGAPFQRVVQVVASVFWRLTAPWGDTAVFSGSEYFIPGMSGGPVFRSDETVVGIVKGYWKGEPISYARALKDTPLCSAAR